MIKLHRDALLSEVATVNALLERSRNRDPLGVISLQARLNSLQSQLDAAASDSATRANIAIIFDGGPVRGSSAIDADFAGQALQDYQEMITRQAASASAGGIGTRGPISASIKQQTKMNVTSLVQGSFGFVLEENDEGQQALLESPTATAVQAVSNLLKGIATADDKWFEDSLPEIDVRLFTSVRNFVSALHKARSSLKLSEQGRDIRLAIPDVERAYERVSSVEVDEEEETFGGELLGIMPIARRFEFRTVGGEVLSGRVAENLSADYLERLEREEMIGGKGWEALVRTKTVRQPNGRHISETRVLLDLKQVRA